MGINAKYGLRTFTRAGISRYFGVGENTVKIPMAIITAPGTLAIKMNENIQDLKSKSCKGQTVTEFSYGEEINPEVNIVCSVGGPEFDSFIHGRLMNAATNYVDGFAYFEIDATKTTFPARVAGQTGYAVTAQSANPNPEIYYVDPVTKLAKVVEIVTATPTGDQMIVGAHLAITLSDDLAASGARIEGWIPVTLPTATIIGSDSLDVVEIKAQGVDFNGKMAGFRARFCSRLAGGDINQAPERQANFRILPDPNDSNGLGFQMFYPDLEVAC